MFYWDIHVGNTKPNFTIMNNSPRWWKYSNIKWAIYKNKIYHKNLELLHKIISAPPGPQHCYLQCGHLWPTESSGGSAFKVSWTYRTRWQELLPWPTKVISNKVPIKILNTFKKTDIFFFCYLILNKLAEYTKFYIH